jgi:hypothetical protein
VIVRIGVGSERPGASGFQFLECSGCAQIRRCGSQLSKPGSVTLRSASGRFFPGLSTLSSSFLLRGEVVDARAPLLYTRPLFEGITR